MTRDPYSRLWTRLICWIIIFALLAAILGCVAPVPPSGVRFFGPFDPDPFCAKYVWRCLPPEQEV